MKRILLVEDDFDVRESLVEVLSDEGYQVAVARDGAEALALLRAGADRPDLILLDLMMAGINGIEFRRQQRADAAIADIPVVIVTADRLIEERARELDVVGFVKKPMDLDTLLAALRKHV